MRYGKVDPRDSVSRWRRLLWHCGTLTLGITLVLLVIIGIKVLPHLLVSSVSAAVPKPNATVPAVLLPMHIAFAAQMIFAQIDPASPQAKSWLTLQNGQDPGAPPKRFFLGKFEVTQAQWRQVMGTSPSAFPGDDRPVESVSWNACQRFCEKLCELEQVPQGSYRLPTVAERDWVCRFGITTAFAHNQENSAWIASNSGQTTHPVGLKLPNAWGVFDLGGNVWEWCSDQTDSSAICCGGGWESAAATGPAARSTGNLSNARNTIGFRVVFVPPGPAEK